ncbi:hypothetical protein LEMLEM_LOCUS1322 [Lemmus lemmus]
MPSASISLSSHRTDPLYLLPADYHPCLLPPASGNHPSTFLLSWPTIPAEALCLTR